VKVLRNLRLIGLTLCTLLLGVVARDCAWGQAGFPQIEEAEVHAFLAQMIPPEMPKSRIEGIAVIVMKSGHIIASEGFGKAHVGQEQPIDARTSVFRAGSLSKPITAALVMQLVQEGRVDLDHDVSDYVGFIVPRRDGRPLTLRDILTQSSGLSDTYRLLFATEPGQAGTLETYARERLPPFLFTPGTQPAYSNYAFGLAGYMVERLRVRPFAAVARELIFDPLGMNTATFSQPPEPNIAAALVQGYRRGGTQPGPFEFVAPESAGGLSVSAADYALFVRALMGTDTLPGHRILRAETAAQMLTLQPGPEGPERTDVGMGLGVTIDRTRVGLTAIDHSGDTVQYHCEFRAYPERDLIIVAMQNTEGPPLVRTIVRRFEEQFGLTPPLLSAMPDSHEDQEVAGIYGTGRYSAHSFLKFGRLLQLMPITANPGGGIRLGAAPEPLTRVGPSLYQDLTRTARRALFIRNDAQQVTGVRVEAYQTMIRLSPWEGPAVVFGAVGLGLASALLALLYFVGRLIWARKHVLITPGTPAISRNLAAICALALILCVAGLYTAVTTMRSDLYLMNPRLDPLIRGFEFAGWVSALAWAGFAVALAAHWSRVSRAKRFAAIGFAAGTLTALVVLVNYHVLTSTLNY
jgi:CubicO group peptidase (beta-lactamase class C family)